MLNSFIFYNIKVPIGSQWCEYTEYGAFRKQSHQCPSNMNYLNGISQHLGVKITFYNYIVYCLMIKYKYSDTQYNVLLGVLKRRYQYIKVKK